MKAGKKNPQKQNNKKRNFIGQKSKQKEIKRIKSKTQHDS